MQGRAAGSTEDGDGNGMDSKYEVLARPRDTPATRVLGRTVWEVEDNMAGRSRGRVRADMLEDKQELVGDSDDAGNDVVMVAARSTTRKSDRNAHSAREDAADGTSDGAQRYHRGGESTVLLIARRTPDWNLDRRIATSCCCATRTSHASAKRNWERTDDRSRPSRSLYMVPGGADLQSELVRAYKKVCSVRLDAIPSAPTLGGPHGGGRLQTQNEYEHGVYAVAEKKRRARVG